LMPGWRFGRRHEHRRGASVEPLGHDRIPARAHAGDLGRVLLLFPASDSVTATARSVECGLTTENYPLGAVAVRYAMAARRQRLWIGIDLCSSRVCFWSRLLRRFCRQPLRP